ncbi:hypothetical protein Q8A73_011121 [Channa argus]|nr:hypothetical protein Q8A73_011121 [Channa argus]
MFLSPHSPFISSHIQTASHFQHLEKLEAQRLAPGPKGACRLDVVPLAASRVRCCTFYLHLSPSCGGLLCRQIGPLSTWKWYKSTVVQEASAISSLLRHKRITVPLTKNHNHMGPSAALEFSHRQKHINCAELRPDWMFGPSCGSDPFDE